MATIYTFKDLRVWQSGRQVRQNIYGITAMFPACEKYNLVVQMRRAAVSITSNLAEGFGRFSYRDNQRACRISRGEAFELLDHIQTCLDQGLIDQATFDKASQELTSFLCLLNGYIRSLGKRSISSNE